MAGHYVIAGKAIPNHLVINLFLAMVPATCERVY